MGAAEPGAAWPAMSLAQADAMLTAPGQMFEMVEVPIGGRPTLSWKNLPPTMREAFELIRPHAANTYAVHGSERIPYEGFLRAVETLAADLAAHGVAKGDRVAIAMRNMPEWPVAFLAALVTGAIAVPLNAWWTGAELCYALNDSGSILLIADEERVDRIAPHRDELTTLRDTIVVRGTREGARALTDILGPIDAWATLPPRPFPAVELGADDHATIFYTSGTTGHPKGAIGTHRSLLTTTLTQAYSVARSALRRGAMPQPTQPKSLLCSIPFFHVTGCHASLIPALLTGSKVVILRRWNAAEALALIERERITTTGGVPTIAWQLVESPDRARYDLSSLEQVSYGGAPAAPELVRRIAGDLGTNPGTGWGMTETSATVTHHLAEDYRNRPDSCGPAVPIAKLRIVDQETGEILPTGAVGELQCYGPMVVEGYWNKPEATAETFRDGWVATGDLARLDEEGFCYICDRAKDMVIRGGENIYPSEIENCLYAHPAVDDAAVVGIPHRTLGEEPAAIVHFAPDASATEDELKAWVAQHLAAFKVPVRILVSPTLLPRNANGKILKKELKALFG